MYFRKKKYHYVVYTNKVADYLEKQNKRQYKREQKMVKKKRKKMVYFFDGRVTYRYKYFPTSL